MDFKGTPLAQVIDDLRGMTGLNIAADMKALNDDGRSMSQPVSASLTAISLKSALNIVLLRLT